MCHCSSNWSANEKAGRKASGVNQLIPLAFAPKVPENYPNFRIFFVKTMIWLLSFFMSLDNKAKGIVCGGQFSKSTYPCSDCTTPCSDFCTGEKTGDTRTVSHSAYEYENFMLKGGKRQNAKDNFNVIHLPLFLPTLEEMKNCHIPIRHFCPPSPLHNKLGITELFHDEMHKIWPTEVDEWVKKALARKSDNPKMKFEGNQCNRLLESLHVFYDQFGNPKDLGMVPYLNALNSYNEVRKSCFVVSDNIDVDLCRQKLEKFKIDSLVLIKDYNVSAINKLHECHVHFLEWIEEFEMGLGYVDEQTGESGHQDFMDFCKGRLIEDIDDPRYLECLRKLVVEYGSKHRKSELCI